MEPGVILLILAANGKCVSLRGSLLVQVRLHCLEQGYNHLFPSSSNSRCLLGMSAVSPLLCLHTLTSEVNCCCHAATVGVITETNAEKAIEELKAYEAQVATVLRNGRLQVRGVPMTSDRQHVPAPGCPAPYQSVQSRLAAFACRPLAASARRPSAQSMLKGGGPACRPSEIMWQHGS